MVSETTILVVSFVTGGASLAIIIIISVYMWKRKRKRQRIADGKSLDKIESETHEEQSLKLKKSEESINTNIMGNETVKIHKQKDVLSEQENQTDKGVSEEKEIYPKFVSLFTIGTENGAKSTRKKDSVTRSQRLNKSINSTNETNKKNKSVKRNETVVFPVSIPKNTEGTVERNDNPVNSCVARSKVDRSDSLLNTFIDKPKVDEEEGEHDKNLKLETKTKPVAQLFRKQSRCWEDLSPDLNDLESSSNSDIEEDTGVNKKKKTTQSDTSDSDNLSYVVNTDRKTLCSIKKTKLENNSDIDTSSWDSDMITKKGKPRHETSDSDDSLYCVESKPSTLVQTELQGQESSTVLEKIEKNTLKRSQTPQPVTENGHKKVSTLFRCKSFPSNLRLSTPKFKPYAKIYKPSPRDSMNNLDSISNDPSTTLAVTDVNDTNLNKVGEPITTNDVVTNRHAGPDAFVKDANTDDEDRSEGYIAHSITNSVSETDREGHTTIYENVKNEQPGIDIHITQSSDTKERTHTNAPQMHYVDESNGRSVQLPSEHEKESVITPIGSSVDCTAASSEPERAQHTDEKLGKNTLNSLNDAANPSSSRIDQVEQNSNIPINIHDTNAEKSKPSRFYEAETLNREVSVSNEYLKPTGSLSSENPKNTNMTSRSRKRKSSVLRAATPIPNTDAKPKRGILKQGRGQKIVLNVSILEEEDFDKHEDTKCAENDAEAHVFNNVITASTDNAIENLEAETHVSYNVSTALKENYDEHEETNHEEIKGESHVYNNVITSPTGNSFGDTDAEPYAFNNVNTAPAENENYDEHEETYHEEIKGEPNVFNNAMTTPTRNSFVETDAELYVFNNVSNAPTENENFDKHEANNEVDIKGEPYVFNNVITTKTGNAFGETDADPYVFDNVNTAPTEIENVDERKETKGEPNVFNNVITTLTGNAFVGTNADSRVLNHVESAPTDTAFGESMSLASPPKSIQVFLTDIASENEMHNDKPRTFVDCSTVEETVIDNEVRPSANSNLIEGMACETTYQNQNVSQISDQDESVNLLQSKPEIEDYHILKADDSAMSAATIDAVNTSDMTQTLDMADSFQQKNVSGYILKTEALSERVDTKENTLVKDDDLDGKSNVWICDNLSEFHDGSKHRDLVLSDLEDGTFNCKQKPGNLFGEDNPYQNRTGTNLKTTQSRIIHVEESKLGLSSDGQCVTKVKNTVDNNIGGDTDIKLVSESSLIEQHGEPPDILDIKVEHLTDDLNSMGEHRNLYENRDQRDNFHDSGPIFAQRPANINTQINSIADLTRASTKKSFNLTKPVGGIGEIIKHVSSSPSQPKVACVETKMDKINDKTNESAEDLHNIKANRRKKKNRSKSLVGLSSKENVMTTQKKKVRKLSYREARHNSDNIRRPIDGKEESIDYVNPSEFQSIHISTRIDATTSSDNKLHYQLVSPRSKSPIVLESTMPSQALDDQTQPDNEYIDACTIDTISKANPILQPVKQRKSIQDKTKSIKTSHEPAAKVIGISTYLTGLIPSSFYDSNAKNDRSDRPKSAKSRSKPLAETSSTHSSGQTGELLGEEISHHEMKSDFMESGLKRNETFHSNRHEYNERRKPVSRSKSIGLPQKRFDPSSSDRTLIARNELQTIAGPKSDMIGSIQTHSYSKYVNETNHVTPNNSSTWLWNDQYKNQINGEQVANNRRERESLKGDPDTNLDKPSLRQRPQSSYGRIKCRSVNETKDLHLGRRPTSAFDIAAGRRSTITRPTERSSLLITHQDDSLSETGSSSDGDEEVKPINSTTTVLNSIPSFRKLGGNMKLSYASKPPFEKNRHSHSFSFKGLNNSKQINNFVHTADSQPVHVAQAPSSRELLPTNSVQRHTVNTDFTALKTKHSTPSSLTPVFTDGSLLQTNPDLNKTSNTLNMQNNTYTRGDNSASITHHIRDTFTSNGHASRTPLRNQLSSRSFSRDKVTPTKGITSGLSRAHTVGRADKHPVYKSSNPNAVLGSGHSLSHPRTPLVSGASVDRSESRTSVTVGQETSLHDRPNTPSSSGGDDQTRTQYNRSSIMKTAEKLKSRNQYSSHMRSKSFHFT